MQSQETRFYLRIESGERQGERVPLAEGAVQVGRKPECGLILTDGSVSGKHAEIRVQGGEVELVDLGSTNGTRVGSEKIAQARLSHGDSVLFGTVRATLQDAQFDLAPKEPGLPRAEMPAPGTDGGTLQRVSAEKVTRSRARSRSWPLALAVIALVVAGGGWAALRLFTSRGGVSSVVAVPSVPGNLLTDASFEGDSEWEAAEAAPQALQRAAVYARSGLLGLGGELEEGGWALARSPEFPLHARRRAECAAFVRVGGNAAGRFGLELSSSTSELPPFIAWLPERGAASAFEEARLAFDSLGAYDRGHLVFAARGAGNLAVDDVSVVEAEPAGGAVHFNEYELSVLGDKGSTAALVRGGRVLLTFDLSSWSRAGLEGWGGARLEAQATERGFRLAFPGAPEDATLRLMAVRPSASAAASESGWCATTGDEGYSAHGGDFTRTGVKSLLLGSGLELLRVGLEKSGALQGAIAGPALFFSLQLGGQQECELQLTFKNERVEAAALAARAQEQERAKQLGAALATWSALLDGFPFERALVAEAEQARSRLVKAGLTEVDLVRRGLDRARFFGLPELFRQGRARALELATQYAGSEVEAEAQQTAEECRQALAELNADDRSGTEARLTGVLQALDPARSPQLSAYVKTLLESVDRASGGD